MRYTESDLVIPTLEVLAESPDGVTTSTLIGILTKKLKPAGKDAEILAGRKDTHFSQKVRNLKSHDTLARKGLASYSKGVFKITQKGRKYLDKDYKDISQSLQDQGFSVKEREYEFNKDYKELVIEEGALVSRGISARKRSAKLTKIAKSFHAKKGKLFCNACGFDFEKQYGELGSGYIEIHHKHPMHDHDIFGERKKVEQVLKSLVPLCSNCHRMVHRKKGELLSIFRLREIIRQVRNS